MRRVFIAGFAIWLAASIVLRFIGQYVLRPESPTAIAILLVSSFPLMALVARRICADANIPREQWPAAVIALVMPSLILDTFSAIFFTTVYPNISPPAAGLFAGWILWCCGGALLGVTFDDEESRAAARSDKPRLVALAHEDAAAAESPRR